MRDVEIGLETHSNCLGNKNVLLKIPKCNCHLILCGKELSVDTQITVIGSVEPEICTKMLNASTITLGL